MLELYKFKLPNIHVADDYLDKLELHDNCAQSYE